MAANTSIIMRIELDKAIGSFAQVAGVIAQAGGDIIAVDVIRAGKQLKNLIVFTLKILSKSVKRT